MSTFRNRMPIEASLASPLCTPNRAGKKLPPLAVASSNTSSRPRRAAAIRADERIQQIRYDDDHEGASRSARQLNSPRLQTVPADENSQPPVDVLIDQLETLHIERKLKFDDEDDDDEQVKQTTKSNEQLLQRCVQLHDRLAYAPNAKLMRYLAEYIILLSGDQDPWLVVTLMVELQAIGFRYNALCIYQRKKR